MLDLVILLSSRLDNHCCVLNLVHRDCAEHSLPLISLCGACLITIVETLKPVAFPKLQRYVANGIIHILFLLCSFFPLFSFFI